VSASDLNTDQQVIELGFGGKLLDKIANIGLGLRQFFSYVGQLSSLSWRFFSELWGRPFEMREILYQCTQIGVASMPIAGFTMLFVGFVFAYQFGVTLQTMGAIPYIGKVTSLAIVRELGPVFTSIVVGGRVGAGMAAEIGSMRVTEQIDAIRALGSSPYKKILVPRVIATTVMLPLVALIAGVIGMLGALFIAWAEFGVSPMAFYNSSIGTISMQDFITGFVKPIFFGFGMAIIACHQGLSCPMGTVGVGKATTRAVVNISLMIVLMDFILIRIFALLPK